MPTTGLPIFGARAISESVPELAAHGDDLRPIPMARCGPMDVHVDCYAGHRGEETPRRFELGGRRVEVLEVLDRWYGPAHRYFKVRGDDGDRLELHHSLLC